MKKHDSKLIYEDDLKDSDLKFYHYDPFNGLHEGKCGFIIYVDSNNFLHNLNGFAWVGIRGQVKEYYIHGKKYVYKDWLIKREELLLEQHRLEILNEI